MDNAERIDSSSFTAASNEYLRDELPDTDETLMQSGLLVLRLANAFQQASERDVLRPLDLRWTGFATTFALSVYGRLEARTLARLIGVSRQAVSSVISTLERDEIVVRKPGDDRRTLIIELTPLGQRKAREALIGQADLSDAWFGGLARDELEVLTGLLRRVLGSRSADSGF